MKHKGNKGKKGKSRSGLIGSNGEFLSPVGDHAPLGTNEKPAGATLGGLSQCVMLYL
jgi:hypothetical protein